MAEARILSYAYMQAHPAEAARVLETLPLHEVAALFSAAPARIGATVLAAMLAATAARAVDAMEDEPAMALLGSLPAQPAALVLRHVSAPKRARLLTGLPATTALASRLLMGYPEDSVGAWTNPQVLALPGDTPAGAALEHLQRAVDEVERLLVLRTGHRPAGWVTAAALLRASPTIPLDALASRVEGLLPARTPLSDAMLHPGWQRSAALPVVEADERLLGVLTSDALARALGRAASGANQPAQATIAAVLALGYWEALSGMVQAATALLPRTAPVGAEHER